MPQDRLLPRLDDADKRDLLKALAGNSGLFAGLGAAVAVVLGGDLLKDILLKGRRPPDIDITFPEIRLPEQPAPQVFTNIQLPGPAPSAAPFVRGSQFPGPAEPPGDPPTKVSLAKARVRDLEKRLTGCENELETAEADLAAAQAARDELQAGAATSIPLQQAGRGLPPDAEAALSALRFELAQERGQLDGLPDSTRRGAERSIRTLQLRIQAIEAGVPVADAWAGGSGLAFEVPGHPGSENNHPEAQVALQQLIREKGRTPTTAPVTGPSIDQIHRRVQTAEDRRDRLRQRCRQLENELAGARSQLNDLERAAEPSPRARPTPRPPPDAPAPPEAPALRQVRDRAQAAREAGEPFLFPFTPTPAGAVSALQGARQADVPSAFELGLRAGELGVSGLTKVGAFGLGGLVGFGQEIGRRTQPVGDVLLGGKGIAPKETQERQRRFLRELRLPGIGRLLP